MAVPALQSEHASAPASEYYPVLHTVQLICDCAPVFGLKVPAAHLVHAVALAREYVPLAHGTQLPMRVAPAFAE